MPTVNSETATVAISASRLGRRFRSHWALSHVTFEVAGGESLLIAGANGSGKTTLLRLIAGLLRPTHGSVQVLGLDPARDRTDARRQLTLVSHHAFLYDGLSAIQMLRLWCRLGGDGSPGAGRETGRKKLGPTALEDHAALYRREDLLELLASVGLERRADDPIGGFSAGMRKRLTLLRTTIERPRVILLDEPFAALDPEGQDMIERWLAGFTAQGKTVIMASHSLPRATRACRRALLLEQGQVVWRGSALDLPRVSAQERAFGRGGEPQPEAEPEREPPPRSRP